MKGLKIAALLLVPVLLSGCYTQLQVQQTQEREYRSESASVDGASKAVQKSDRDMRRRSVTGYYGAGHYKWNSAYHRFHSGFHPYHSGYYSSWWDGYHPYHYRPGTRVWLSFRFGWGYRSSHFGWHDYYAWNPYSPWRGAGFGHYYQFNNFYLFGDEFQGGFAVNRDNRENARYGPRSIGSSRIGSDGSSRADGRSIGSRSGDGQSADAVTRVRGGSSDVTRSSGTVTRTRSGGTGSGNAGSSGSSRSRGGNDDGNLDRSRSDDTERIRYRPLPTSSSSSGTRFPVFRVEPRDGEENEARVRTSAVDWRDYSFGNDALRSRLEGYRVEGPENVRVTRSRSRGGFLQRLGEFFESSRKSYEGFYPDRGNYGSRSRDGGSSSRGTVTRSSDSDNTRSRGGSSGSSRSRGSGGGDDDGNSRSRGGN